MRRRLADISVALMAALFCLAYPAVYPRHLAARMADEYKAARTGERCCASGCDMSEGAGKQNPRRTSCPVCRAVDGLAPGVAAAPSPPPVVPTVNSMPPREEPRTAEGGLPLPGSRDPPSLATSLHPRAA